MTYVAEWQRLSYALDRLMEAGLLRRPAKEALCNLIVDGQVKVRLTPTQRVSNLHDTFMGFNIKVPSWGRKFKRMPRTAAEWAALGY
jgi:hypothetical protein